PLPGCMPWRFRPPMSRACCWRPSSWGVCSWLLGCIGSSSRRSVYSSSPRWHLFVLLVSGFWLAPQAWRQSPTPPPSRVSVTSSRVDVPSPLTLEVAEQLLVQYNLAVVAARYGVDR